MMKQTRRMMLDKAGAQEAVDDYMSSLADLTVNSKPHINALTFLAEDYLNYAEAIVNAVDDHLQKVPSNVKLPILYLIDSIIKNVGKDYIALFSSTMVHSFCTVFKQVDEKTRHQMYKLRLTWNEIYSQEDLYAMDVGVNALDPNWPITAAPAQSATHKIHINPKFLQTSTAATPVVSGPVSPVISPECSPTEAPKPNPTELPAVPTPKAAVDAATEVALREQLLQRKRDLLQLQQEKVVLELSQMKAKLDKKQKAVCKLNDKPSQEILPVLVPVKDKIISAETAEDDIVMVKEIRSSREDSKKVIKPAKDATVSALPSAPKIAPVSSGLINLVTSQRAQRDPRLSKQSKDDIPKEETSKSRARSRDPRISSKPEKRSRSSEKESSKSSRRHSRDVSSDRSSSRHSSRREDRDTRSNESRKSNRKSEDRSSTRSKKTSSHSPSKSEPLKRDRRDSTRSPRKSSYTNHRPGPDCADSPESDASDSKNRVGSPLSPRTGSMSASSSSSWSVNYTKGSHKGRNYVRKNLQEESPEVVSSSVSSDVDLRVSAPPEKQPRLANPSERVLHSSSSSLSPGVPDQILPTIACQDVDLRCLSSSPGKKRRSAEPEDGPPPSKKNKASYIEMLFGKQDVDLRQLDMKNGVSKEAPSPPPPPIISSLEGQNLLKDDSLDWSKFKQTLTPSPTVERSPAFPRSSRHERLGRSTEENEQSPYEDTDMRLPMNGLGPKPDFQAILTRAAEQVKNGTMSEYDFGKVQKQLFRMQESEKIREAQRNDYSRREHAWERRPREKDYRHGMRSPESDQFGDIDERFPVSRPGKKTLLPLPMVPPIHPDGIHHPRHMGQHMPGSMSGQGYMRPQPSILGPGPRGRGRGWRFPRTGPGFNDNPISLPLADSFILDKIAQDTMKIINIDGVGRQIRFYGEDAVAILTPDNACEIAFDPGDASVIINDVVVHCSFHKQAKEVNIGGKIYRVRLGAPTRELYVNDEGFECQFNCPPKEVHLDTGEILLVQLQAEEPPKVHVGAQRRDLVAGFVTLVIDAEICISIFLDAKPQRFDIEGVPHIIKFADALKTVLINNQPVNIVFGGHPVPVLVNNRRHYIRLTELPSNMVPGEVEIVSMSHFRTKAPAARTTKVVPWGKNQVSQISQPVEVEHEPALHEPALPVRGGLGVLTRGMPKKIMKPRIPRRDREPTESFKSAKTEDRQMPAELLQAIQPGLPSLLGLLPSSNKSGYNCNTPSVCGTYGMRQGVVSSTGVGPATASVVMPSANSSASTAKSTATHQPSATSLSPNGIPLLASEPDITKLLQSLYDTGIISAISKINDTKKDKAKEEEETKKKVHEVDFKEASSSFKVKQPALIDILYSGIQCSSCGTRFPPEQTEKYSSHLDWHFRQNRRDKDSARKPQSRKWYYDVTDWIQFEEIDDTVEKTQNWFDTQQSDASKFEETEEEEIQSVPSKDFPEGTVCELCHDRFDQFYNEDKEEWHLKDCLVADGLPYHPFCYKDYRVSLESNEDSEDPERPSPDSGVPADSEAPADSAVPADSEAPADSAVPADSEAPADTAVASADTAVASADTAAASAGTAAASADTAAVSPDTAAASADSAAASADTAESADTVASTDTMVSADTVASADSAVPAEATADDAVGINNTELEIPVKEMIKREPEEGPCEDDATGVVETDSERKADISEEERIEKPSMTGIEELCPHTSTKKEEPMDAADAEIKEGLQGHGGIAVKEEPVDEEMNPAEDCSAPIKQEDFGSKDLEELHLSTPVMNTNPAVVSCLIDGNLELSQASSGLPSVTNRIKINISKPIFAKPVEESEDDSDSESEKEEQAEPVPPGDETIVLKPKLVGRKLRELPPRVRGTETSGLCSIM